MTEKSQDEIQLVEYCSTIRGAIIHKTTELELLIDYYIALHFANKNQEKAKELMELVLSSRMMLGEKRLIFKHLIDTHYNDFKIAYPKFHSDIEKIMDQRNIFAHYTVNTNKDAIQRFINHSVIYLMKFKNVLSAIPYSESKIKEIITMIDFYTVAVGKLISLTGQ